MENGEFEYSVVFWSGLTLQKSVCKQMTCWVFQFELELKRLVKDSLVPGC